jgi:hypothetical protein
LNERVNLLFTNVASENSAAGGWNDIPLGKHSNPSEIKYGRTPEGFDFVIASTPRWIWYSNFFHILSTQEVLIFVAELMPTPFCPGTSTRCFNSIHPIK